MDYIKPCPFCGSKAIKNTKRLTDERFNCSKPGCYMSETWREFGVSRHDWNTRPIESALLEACKEALLWVSGQYRSTDIEPILNAAIAKAEGADHA